MTKAAYSRGKTEPKDVDNARHRNVSQAMYVSTADASLCSPSSFFPAQEGLVNCAKAPFRNCVGYW